ncbi:nucleoside/nucleotide kinase family protein [Sandarakinorhabdus rubra]|uniref:shikimate kinase n=1 Tax=Sandarakinorhabdus rubra TaxID=2672568 RepID=UPI0013D96FA0|nr:shikimate kinase [Sandarakinorhabdus rubra]
MKLLFLHGPPAAGKYSIGRRVAEATGLPLFHNHLVVDAVASVFPFGSPGFVRLREAFWLSVLEQAAAEQRSLIFTFQPEPSVSPGFPAKAAALYADAGGACLFVRLHLSLEQQLVRIANADRGRFGKLQDADLLRRLHADFERAEAAMPASALEIDTGRTAPEEAAAHIVDLLGG